jgi:hypothetical protein
LITTLVPAAAETYRPAAAGTWEIDVDRCAVEMSYALFGVTVWLRRLRTIDAQVVCAADAPTGQLSGLFASRGREIRIAGEVRLRFTTLDDDHAIVSALGVIAPRIDTPIPAALCRIEMAAEVVRCA